MPAARKIVIIGPESTGKSTLSAALAAHLATPWVPEYARHYLETLGRHYEERDLPKIAEGQCAAEDALLPHANTCLICDTDLYVLKVWSESSFGRCHRKILERIATRPYHLYLLTNIDVPWTPDPLREHGEYRERNYFYNQYRDIVQQSGVPWVDIRGNDEERLELAIAAVSTFTS